MVRLLAAAQQVAGVLALALAVALAFALLATLPFALAFAERRILRRDLANGDGRRRGVARVRLGARGRRRRRVALGLLRRLLGGAVGGGLRRRAGPAGRLTIAQRRSPLGTWSPVCSAAPRFSQRVPNSSVQSTTQPCGNRVPLFGPSVS
jgi:hypothetical protein